MCKHLNIALSLVGPQINPCVVYSQSCEPSKTKSGRNIFKLPEKILDAPDIKNDFCEFCSTLLIDRQAGVVYECCIVVFVKRCKTSKPVKLEMVNYPNNRLLRVTKHQLVQNTCGCPLNVNTPSPIYIDSLFTTYCEYLEVLVFESPGIPILLIN